MKLFQLADKRVNNDYGSVQCAVFILLLGVVHVFLDSSVKGSCCQGVESVQGRFTRYYTRRCYVRAVLCSHPHFSLAKMTTTTLFALILITTLAFCPLSTVVALPGRSSSPDGGRYSYSLSTFDKEGRLNQVERAQRAANLGPPVVAVSLHNGQGCVMASLFGTPSPLLVDDGTARFVRISDTIAVAHSGVSADGRAVTAAAQRLAVEHAYTFHDDGSADGSGSASEAIPIDLFLEEVSQLFQRYTMKPGCRPFGCSLVVAHIPQSGICDNSRCRLYRIDPSGMVQMVEPICCIGGGGVVDKIVQKLEERNCADASSLEDAERILLDAMRNALEEEGNTTSTDGNASDALRIPPGPTFLH